MGLVRMAFTFTNEPSITELRETEATSEHWDISQPLAQKRPKPVTVSAGSVFIDCIRRCLTGMKTRRHCFSHSKPVSAP